VIQQQTAGYIPQATYPTSGLGNALKSATQLLTGNLGIGGITVGIGGWDTHSDQNALNGGTIGYHDALLKDLSDSITAFYQDIEAQGLADKVILVTMSDFGRTAQENADQGTDHGLSSVSFVVGNAVKGGAYNAYPSLDASALFNDGLGIQSDFRSVYATIAQKFLNVDPALVTGGSFPLLDFL